LGFEGQFSIVTNEHQRDLLIQEIKDRFEAHGYLQIKMTEAKTRTSRQNNALHLYCRIAAKDLNDAGCDQRKVLKPSMSIPWTMESFKENLFKPVMAAMFGHTTTADLKTGQVGEVYDTINRELSEKFGVQTSFPDRGGR
tara:strand:+ start:185 stop:604 length:420 start_codon:yes stop_codon:yes gene_type:complete